MKNTTDERIDPSFDDGRLPSCMDESKKNKRSTRSNILNYGVNFFISICALYVLSPFIVFAMREYSEEPYYWSQRIGLIELSKEEISKNIYKCWRKGNYKGCAKRFLELDKRSIKNIPAHAEMYGVILSDAGEAKDALSYLIEAEKYKPVGQAALRAKCKSSYSVGNLDMAFGACYKHLMNTPAKRTPDDAIIKVMTDLFLNQGRFAELLTLMKWYQIPYVGKYSQENISDSIKIQSDPSNKVIALQASGGVYEMQGRPVDLLLLNLPSMQENYPSGYYAVVSIDGNSYHLARIDLKQNITILSGDFLNHMESRIKASRTGFSFGTTNGRVVLADLFEYDSMFIAGSRVRKSKVFVCQLVNCGNSIGTDSLKDFKIIDEAIYGEKIIRLKYNN